MVDASTTTATADTTGITADNVFEPSFSADQYGQAARNLLPRGRAWNREDGSNQADFCDALGLIYAQQDSDSVQMLADFFPATASQGVDEWNSSLGLPDPCGGAPATLAANQQQILAKLIATGGQSIAYLTDLATALGYEISITEFSPTETGADAPAGFVSKPADWAYSWRVNVLSGPADTTILKCLFDRYKPAHTQYYIVIGTSPTTTTRLFSVVDNVTDELLITTTTR